MPTNGTWEDCLGHVVHIATNCVGACCCTLAVFTWASKCHTGVVVVHIATMCEAVIPVLEPFHWQGGEAAWGLMSSVVTAPSAAIAAATTDVATAFALLPPPLDLPLLML